MCRAAARPPLLLALSHCSTTYSSPTSNRIWKQQEHHQSHDSQCSLIANQCLPSLSKVDPGRFGALPELSKSFRKMECRQNATSSDCLKPGRGAKHSYSLGPQSALMLLFQATRWFSKMSTLPRYDFQNLHKVNHQVLQTPIRRLKNRTKLGLLDGGAKKPSPLH